MVNSQVRLFSERFWIYWDWDGCFFVCFFLLSCFLDKGSKKVEWQQYTHSHLTVCCWFLRALPFYCTSLYCAYSRILEIFRAPGASICSFPIIAEEPLIWEGVFCCYCDDVSFCGVIEICFCEHLEWLTRKIFGLMYASLEWMICLLMPFIMECWNGANIFTNNHKTQLVSFLTSLVVTSWIVKNDQVSAGWEDWSHKSWNGSYYVRFSFECICKFINITLHIYIMYM